MPNISPYIITFLALLFALEYIGRFILIKPRNLLWLGKAITRLNLSATYFVYVAVPLPAETKIFFSRLGIIILLTIDLFYVGIEHYQSITGHDNRSGWIMILYRKIKG